MYDKLIIVVNSMLYICRYLLLLYTIIKMEKMNTCVVYNVVNMSDIITRI